MEPELGYRVEWGWAPGSTTLNSCTLKLESRDQWGLMLPEPTVACSLSMLSRHGIFRYLGPSGKGRQPKMSISLYSFILLKEQ